MRSITVLSQCGDSVRVVSRGGWFIVQQISGGEWTDLRFIDGLREGAETKAIDDAKKLATKGMWRA